MLQLRDEQLSAGLNRWYSLPTYKTGATVDHIELSGEWRLSVLSGPTPSPIRDIPARIPGDNATALLQAGAIKPPYEGRNELELQWIGGCDWELHREFTLDAPLDGVSYIVAESIDTVAELRINGVEVARSGNMFSSLLQRIEPGILKKGTNVISVKIASPERVATERAEALETPAPYSSYPVQSPNRNMLRKVQCHAGWDWGPSLPVSGIYGRIAIVATDQPLLHQMAAVARKADDSWAVEIDLNFAPAPDSFASRETEVEVAIASPDGTTIGTAKDTVTIAPTGTAAKMIVSVAEPELWWPNGMGDRPLYTVTVTAGGQTLRRRIGFRTLELRRERDEGGESFTFVVNEQPLFAKGSNWIPQDALPGSGTSDQLRWLLESAAQANHNMIRVWGGGRYESEEFYDLCDELGLLVWQDFMFACSMYPDTDWFLNSVAEEVRYQVMRLKSRACLALWCGNNENVGALGWYEESRKNRDRYLVAYDRLNEGVVGRLCREIDPDHDFWPSSPADGIDAFGADWAADETGDMHYWAVWHQGKPFAAYREVTPRFCSEFGYQSFSSLSELQSFAQPEDWNVTSPVMEHHQRNDRGNALIVSTMCRYYRLPTRFEHYLYLSQVQQAHAIRTAVEFWRSRTPRCMGALYWQLNDVWPVASWSSIEYSGKWKLLHYASARFFASPAVVAIPLDEAGRPQSVEERPPVSWSIYVINDGRESLHGGLTLSLIGYDGTPIHTEEVAGLNVPAGSSTRVHTFSRTDLIKDPSRAFGIARFAPDGAPDRRHLPALTTQFYLDHPKRSALQQAQLNVEVTGSGNELTVRLSADRPCFEVALDAGALRGRFTDNLLTVLPDAPVEVSWIARTAVTEREFRDTLQITHLSEIGADS